MKLRSDYREKMGRWQWRSGWVGAVARALARALGTIITTPSLMVGLPPPAAFEFAALQEADKLAPGIYDSD